MLEGTIDLRDVVELIALDVRRFNRFIDDMNRSEKVDMDDKVFMYARKHMRLAGEMGLACRMGIDISVVYGNEPCCLERIEYLKYKRSDDETWEVYELG